MRPLAMLVDPVFRPQTDTRRRETAETLGDGEGGVRGAERSGSAKPRKIGGFGGGNPRLVVFRRVPSCSAPFRRFPKWSAAPDGLSLRVYIPPADQYQEFRNRRNVGYWGREEERINERAKLGNAIKSGFGG